MTKLIIAGATGLIGGKVAESALDRFDSVQCLVRQPSAQIPQQANQQVVDFNFPEFPQAESNKDAVICALGTTIKKAGSQQAFRRVDLDYVSNLAQAAYRNGYRRFLVVSSLGADKKSKNFYLRVKGEMEAAIQEPGFEQIAIVRPSLLLGERKEFRFGEKVGEVLGKILSPLFVKGLKKYKPIDAQKVAERLINQALNQESWLEVFESNQI